jgi:hypothetical protein
MSRREKGLCPGGIRYYIKKRREIMSRRDKGIMSRRERGKRNCVQKWNSDFIVQEGNGIIFMRERNYVQEERYIMSGRQLISTCIFKS